MSTEKRMCSRNSFERREDFKTHFFLAHKNCETFVSWRIKFEVHKFYQPKIIILILIHRFKSSATILSCIQIFPMPFFERRESLPFPCCCRYNERLPQFQFQFSIVIFQLGDLSNPELRMLTDQLDKIRFGGDETPVKRLSVRGLLPDTEHYMTYEGSTTSPACHETVTWIVLNKPIYITKQQVSVCHFNDIRHEKAICKDFYCKF